MQLRPYQNSAVDQIIAYADKHPKGRLLVVLPPGGGKTAILAAALQRLTLDKGKRGLVWAHRRELVGQCFDHLLACGAPANMLGVIMRGDPRTNFAASVFVASIDTLRARDKPPADVIASDEAHRDASDGRRRMRALYPDAFHVGFTATPYRLDGRGLDGDYDEMIVVAQPGELIEAGYLAAPKIFTVPPEMLPDLRGVRTRAGDFEPDALERAANRRALVGHLIDHWKRLAKGRRTMIFPVGVKHSHHIVDRFREAGVSAEHLDAHTPLNERRAILEALTAGAVSVVSSCGVLSEGIDVPAVKCVMMARPTHSLTLTIQQAGRCMRPWKSTTPLILDHAGNIVRHGPPQMDRDWSLHDYRNGGGGKRAGGEPVKVCEHCQAVVHAAVHVCPECGQPFPSAPAVPREEAHDLEEFRLGKKQKVAELARLYKFASERGFSAEWVEKVYRAKFGEQAA